MVGDRGGTICHWCGEPLHWNPKKHRWEHPGGGLYIQVCRSCGARIDQPEPATKCPVCGSTDIVDDHCALPVHLPRHERRTKHG